MKGTAVAAVLLLCLRNAVQGKAGEPVAEKLKGLRQLKERQRELKERQQEIEEKQRELEAKQRELNTKQRELDKRKRELNEELDKRRRDIDEQLDEQRRQLDKRKRQVTDIGADSKKMKVAPACHEEEIYDRPLLLDHPGEINQKGYNSSLKMDRRTAAIMGCSSFLFLCVVAVVLSLFYYRQVQRNQEKI